MIRWQEARSVSQTARKVTCDLIGRWVAWPLPDWLPFWDVLQPLWTWRAYLAARSFTVGASLGAWVLTRDKCAASTETRCRRRRLERARYQNVTLDGSRRVPVPKAFIDTSAEWTWPWVWKCSGISDHFWRTWDFRNSSKVGHSVTNNVGTYCIVCGVRVLHGAFQETGVNYARECPTCSETIDSVQTSRIRFIHTYLCNVGDIPRQ